MWLECPKCRMSIPERPGSTWTGTKLGTVWHIDRTREELTVAWNRRAAPSLDGLRAMVERFRAKARDYRIGSQIEQEDGQDYDASMLDHWADAHEKDADELAAEIERMGRVTPAEYAQPTPDMR